MAQPESQYKFLSNPDLTVDTRLGKPAAGSSYLDESQAESIGGEILSVALIGPNGLKRYSAASALRDCSDTEVHEYEDYPASLDEIPQLLEQNHDAIILDLDSNPEYALELVESICAKSSATVMVYSAEHNSDMLVRCMRAGAREFLTPPFSQTTMVDALVRAAARRTTRRPKKKVGGRLLVFLGAKGGAGVTTVACNFAVALAQESGESTLLIDLDLPLGDAALNLGIIAEYSTVNALQDYARLDFSLLNKLLVKHSSGVSVLAAPGKFPNFNASNEAIDKLLAVARAEFDNVIVDVGSKLDLTGTALYKEASTIYLVTQAGIPELRNSNRLISQFFSTGAPKLDIVVNRYEPRSQGINDETINKALTRPAQWKIPNDYATVRKMQNTATPFTLNDSSISRLIRQMARSITGKTEELAPQKKKGFSLFGK